MCLNGCQLKYPTLQLTNSEKGVKMKSKMKVKPATSGRTISSQLLPCPMSMLTTGAPLWAQLSKSTRSQRQPQTHHWTAEHEIWPKAATATIFDELVHNPLQVHHLALRCHTKNFPQLRRALIGLWLRSHHPSWWSKLFRIDGSFLPFVPVEMRSQHFACFLG